MFFLSKSLILGNLLRLHISRQSRPVSLNCSHSNIICLIVRITLLQSSQWGATSSHQVHHHSLYTVCGCMSHFTLFITTSSLHVHISPSIQIKGTGMIYLNLSIYVSHHFIHLSTSAFLITI